MNRNEMLVKLRNLIRDLEQAEDGVRLALNDGDAHECFDATVESVKIFMEGVYYFPYLTPSPEPNPQTSKEFYKKRSKRARIRGISGC